MEEADRRLLNRSILIRRIPELEAISGVEADKTAKGVGE